MSYALRNLVDASTLPRREKTIAREVAYYVRDDAEGRVAVSVAQLVARSGYSDRVVRTILHALRRRGILTIAEAHSPGQARTYVFHGDRVPRRGYEPRQTTLSFDRTGTDD